MRIGIVPNLERGGGGIYQYSVTMLALLPEVLAPSDELVVFLYVGEELPPDLAGRGYHCVDMRSLTGAAARLSSQLRPFLPLGVVRTLRRMLGRKDDPLSSTAPGEANAPEDLIDPRWQRFFAEQGVDLLIFTADVDLAYRTGVPFMVAVHDIQHRLQPEFPEVTAGGEWERREFRVGHCVRGAVGVLVDSEVGREDIVEAYGIDSDMISVVPFVPANYLPEEISAEQVARVVARHGLPQRFLFYPAAFWPHKNHLRIIEAIAELRHCGLDAPMVLSGPNGGAELRRQTFVEAMDAATALGIADLVTYLGYVEDDEMGPLYQAATALLMPTFFGPTNIPVVEAFRYGCPVITSDIRGIREQVRDAAVLVDPRSVSAIAEGIRSVFEDEQLVARLKEAGYEHLKMYSVDDFKRCVSQALACATGRLRTSAAPEGASGTGATL